MPDTTRETDRIRAGYPSTAAMKAAVECEIFSAVGTLTTQAIGDLFDRYFGQTLASELEACAQIAEAIDSNRGNEKEIARAIRARANDYAAAAAETTP